MNDPDVLNFVDRLAKTNSKTDTKSVKAPANAVEITGTDDAKAEVVTPDVVAPEVAKAVKAKVVEAKADAKSTKGK